MNVTAPRRCAKPDCRNLQPCPVPGHNTKNWSNVNYYRRIPEKDKREVIRMSGGVCRKCGRMAPGEVDHIINVARGGLNEMSNYQFLCKRCHKEKTIREIKYGQRSKGSNRHPR